MPATVATRKRLAWDLGELSMLWRDGPKPIVFLHGLCGGAVYYDAAFEAAELKGRGLVAVDLPGFGESQSEGATEVGISAQREACRAVFASLGKNVRPALVAHSMAGSVASQLLTDISALVLLEGNVVVENLEFSDRILGMAADGFEADYARLSSSAEMMMRLQTAVTDNDRRNRYASTYHSCSAQTVRRVAEDVNEDARSGAISHRLAAWGQRFYYYVGSGSNFDASILLAHGLDAVVRRISGARHFLMLDNPSETYGAIARDTTS
jgi:pimeloyl-ACP methyl ester carboxylesterase